MAVKKSAARLLGPQEALIGEGRAYVHLREPLDRPQRAQGTLSLEWWDDGAGRPASLDLADGPTLAIEVESDRLSGCLTGRILRYRATWPGT